MLLCLKIERAKARAALGHSQEILDEADARVADSEVLQLGTVLTHGRQQV